MTIDNGNARKPQVIKKALVCIKETHMARKNW